MQVSWTNKQEQLSAGEMAEKFEESIEVILLTKSNRYKRTAEDEHECVLVS